MIPIKEAISSGAWLHCSYLVSYSQKLIEFRVLVRSFRKVNLSEIDSPERIGNFDTNSSIWLLEIEIVNLTKEPISNVYTTWVISLVDQDGFSFFVFGDTYLRRDSQFSAKSKMSRFYGNDLSPKIKAVGTIPFQLPDDDEAEYSITLKEGTIREA